MCNTENVINKQVSYANLSRHPIDNNCANCNKFCRSPSGLRTHVMIHCSVVGHANPITPIKDTTLFTHICMKTMESNAGLKCHLLTSSWDGSPHKRRER